jgi:hypothetical protein
MDHLAPPAPMLTFAAKRLWQPPPPKSPAELKREAEWEMMYRRGLVPRVVRKPVMPPMLFSFKEGPITALDTMQTVTYIEEIVWEPRPAYHFVAPIAPIREPRHRRNT